MNVWLEYLKECLFDEIDIVLNLAGIDQQVQGEKNEVNDLIGIMEPSAVKAATGFATDFMDYGVSLERFFLINIVK